MRKLAWGSKAWKDYLYWQSQDKKTLKRKESIDLSKILYQIPLKELVNPNH